MTQVDKLKQRHADIHANLVAEDERSIANKLAREEKRQNESEPISKEARDSQVDPTLPAKNHGNEPSKGAKIDAEIKQEEEEMLRKKGIK
ncbi:MAG: hypothetical protein Q9172_002606 [Xanthocarpia lactea]